MRTARLICVLLAVTLSLMVTGMAGAAQSLKIAGAGGMIPLVTELAKAYMAEQSDVLIEVNQKSIESTGGIMGASEGRIDIGMSARKLKDDEKKLGLSEFEIARAATVVAVNKGVAVSQISIDKLCMVYSGKIKNWKDLGGADEPILVLTRPDRDATKDSVRKNISCFKDLKEPETVVIVATAPEMAKILSSQKGAIGFADSVAVEDSAGAFRSLKLEGVAPTIDNIRSGKYSVIKNFLLLTKGQPSVTVKGFIDFVKGPKGARIIEANKAVAVK